MGESTASCAGSTAAARPRSQGRPRSACSSPGKRQATAEQAPTAIRAAVLEEQAGKVAAARIAVGACSAVARRLPALERALVGRPWDRGLAGAVEPAQLAVLSPIDDVRAGAAYRRDAALVLLRRVIESLGEAA